MSKVLNPKNRYYIYMPSKGLYAYYDSRVNISYLVKTDNFSEQYVGCNYCLDFLKENEPFITCQGKIIEIKQSKLILN
jgi:hypothetical protein|tara:strand:+ start:2869 stop:3102 length:234 start_codon:yes stop_codon:yes gene_type:complete